MPSAVLTRFSYPKVPGDQPWSVVDIRGPAVYQSITANGANGGQPVSAADCDLESIDWAMVTGTPAIVPVRINVILTGVTPGNSATGLSLVWMIQTGEMTDSANLSAVTIRLLVIGRN